jgi:hypothetical protein
MATTWTDMKTSIETHLTAIASGDSFGIRQVTRAADDSVVTYSSFKEMIDAYEAVCVLAEKEAIGTKSQYRPITVRQGSHRTL